MSSRFIITITPELEKSAFLELRRVAPDLEKIQQFQNGAILVETHVAQFASALGRQDPIFIKHIHPVDAVVSLTGKRSADLPLLLAATQSAGGIAPGEHFSVQCRHVATGHDYVSKDVEVSLGSFFESAGSIPVFSDDKVEADRSQRVLSIYIFQERGYVGLSTIRDNLNEHSDEYRVFSRHARRVSRAEFKLREALRKFGINLKGGRALDLGAAPGGWTLVLAEAGMQVVAVDPAALSPLVTALPNVTHFKGKSEDYHDDGAFDLIVDDMNVEPEASARILVSQAHLLKRGSYAILTCKFVIRNTSRLLENIRWTLEEEYEILRIKNLFHNRMEVTLLLRRK
ncbi:MAG: SAM-dependent methyltransferase [Rudaea sp.]